MKADRKNLIALLCGGMVVLMTGAAFAAVPLYQLFCDVTGFGGTTMRAEAASTEVLDETVLVRFDTNVRGLPMTFRAEAKPARDLFAFSILYLMLLFAALLIERLPASQVVCPSCV